METQPLFRDRIITADASKVSPREFLRAVIGDANDITAYPRVGKYFLRGGAWCLVKPEHYTREQIVDVEHGTAPDTGNDRVAA